jgi:uncharacterized protein
MQDLAASRASWRGLARTSERGWASSSSAARRATRRGTRRIETQPGARRRVTTQRRSRARDAAYVARRPPTAADGRDAARGAGRGARRCGRDRGRRDRAYDRTGPAARHGRVACSDRSRRGRPPRGRAERSPCTAKPATLSLMAECRSGCGACCIAPSISPTWPSLPEGKAAGVRCPHLDADTRCALFGSAHRPAVCSSLRPAQDMCGDSATEAMATLVRWETLTAPRQRPMR